MAPTMAWEVLMGRRITVMIVTVMAAATVAITRVAAVCSVRPLRVWMPRSPCSAAPTMMATAQRRAA